MKILIFSKTPLVNSPSNFKKAFELIGYNCDLVYLERYPRSKTLFDEPDYYFYENFNSNSDYELILFHNILDEEIIKKFDKNAKKVLFIHSSCFDGPIYHNFHLNNLDHLFDKTFSLSQGHSRFYPETNFFCNILHPAKFFQDLDISASIRVNYTKSLSSFGRFGSKNPTDLFEKISKVNNFLNEKIIFKYYQNISNRDLIKLKQYDHISIDDCFTGAFHQVSLEALASGGIAVNGADDFTILNFLSSIESTELPPFIRVISSDDLINNLISIISDRKKLKKLMMNSRDYYKTFMAPKRLIKILLKNIYDN